MTELVIDKYDDEYKVFFGHDPDHYGIMYGFVDDDRLVSIKTPNDNIDKIYHMMKLEADRACRSVNSDFMEVVKERVAAYLGHK